jgi:heme-degrading monooxygenase HmoA
VRVKVFTRRRSRQRGLWQDCAVTMVTVFRSRLRPGVQDDYSPVADEMSRLVQTIDGFMDQRFYISPDGERVTIVRFRDPESHQRWARHPDHLAAQERGRGEFYSWYDISVCEELYSRDFEGPES